MVADLLVQKMWMLSGLGLGLPGGWWGLQVYMAKRRKKRAQASVRTAITAPVPVNPVGPFDAEAFKVRPYPREIINEVEIAPAFQKQWKRDRHVGRKVQWQVLHYETRWAKVAPQDEVLMMPLTHKDRHTKVHCELKLEDHPELRAASRGTQFWVAGTVKEVGPDHLVLTDVRLTKEPTADAESEN